MDAMTPAERRASLALASVFALRMLGMFLVLPVFSVAARQLPGGSDYTLVGVALGAYGLTQAILQIPFGLASDRLGRKPVIVFGLLLFALGCGMASVAGDIYWMIAGRILQGAGAVSAAVSALAADLTRERQRTKAMAMIGASIGLVFALSLVVAPPLYAWLGLSGLFVLTGALSLAAIGVVLRIVPPAPAPRIEAGGDARAVFAPPLLRLNFGIFSLHLIQMAMFMVIPSALEASGLSLAGHWKVYLPAVLLSFAAMIPAILQAEQRGRMKTVLLGAIALLLLTEIGFLFGRIQFWTLTALVLSFFVSFNILEAILPSLVSRMAPAGRRGLALGIFNTMQAAGLFTGGFLGGWLLQRLGGDAVFIACALLALSWLGIAAGLRLPPGAREDVEKSTHESASGNVQEHPRDTQEGGWADKPL